MGIVVLGAVFVDIKGYPSDVYIPGGRNAGRVEQMHGGVSRNIVEDIANVELQPTFIGLVDDTGAGADVVRKLKAHKVNTDYIRVTKDGMGTWLAIFDNGGDVVAAISKRPDLRPILSILEEQGDEIISRADSIAFEIDMDKEIVKKVFALADEMMDRVGQFMKKYRDIGDALSKAQKLYDEGGKKLEPSGQSILQTCAKLQRLGASQSAKNPLPQL